MTWQDRSHTAFRDARWTLRRYSFRTLLYRMRISQRRHRWSAERERLAAPFFKNPTASSTSGSALVFGELADSNGFARGAAYDLEIIRSRHTNIHIVDIGPYIKGKAALPLTFPGPIENVYFLCQPDTYGLICQLLEPDQIANAYRIGRWVWETPEFPDEWRFAERLVHEIWAPSAFCAEVFHRATSLPTHVVPHAVTAPTRSNIDMRAELGLSSETFVGLAVMDIRSCPPRKNPWGHVLAWQMAFGHDPSAVLVLKIRVGKRTRVVLSELREMIGGARNVILLTDDLSHQHMAALQYSCDVFLSLHRSEGYGLNIHEMLLCGKPVIATDWSANVEYGHSFQNYIPVEYRMIPYQDWTKHYGSQIFTWADPDLNNAAERLRAVRERDQSDKDRIRQ